MLLPRRPNSRVLCKKAVSDVTFCTICVHFVPPGVKLVDIRNSWGIVWVRGKGAGPGRPVHCVVPNAERSVATLEVG